LDFLLLLSPLNLSLNIDVVAVAAEVPLLLVLATILQDLSQDMIDMITAVGLLSYTAVLVRVVLIALTVEVRSSGPQALVTPAESVVIFA
jgi:hypothetical protein